MFEKSKILTINPGSTSTKVAVFENMECISTVTIKHSPAELAEYRGVIEQYTVRKQTVIEYLSKQGIPVENLNAIVGRGGLLKPLTGGTYYINSKMINDLKSLKYGEHASNLGAVIAYEISALKDIPAFIVNPVVVDELETLARYSGLSCISRKSVFHALNQKAVAARAAGELGKKYGDVNLIVAHLGGGISVGAHCKGKVIDVNNGLEEGAFSPERSGSLPVLQLIDLCFSAKYSKNEIKKMVVGKGGFVDYLGTSDCIAIEKMIDSGDKNAKEVFEAMAYQIAKEIASYSAVLYGKVDGIILTGGLARSNLIVKLIEERVRFIAHVRVYPGEDEMLAMAEGAYKVLTGQERILNYE